MIKRLITTALVASALGFYLGQNPGLLNISTKQKLEAEVASIGVAISYTCPMHPDIHSEEQGKCPICGMSLVENKLNKTIASADNISSSPIVNIPFTVRNNLSIRTATVEKGDLAQSIETIGKITRLDPTARRILTPPISGELVFIAQKIDGDPVKQGELLFSVISPELIEKEKSYQTAYKSGNLATATAMIPGLRKAGLSPEQISRLQMGELADLPVHVYSSEPGFIFSRRGQVGDSVSTGFTVFNLGGDYQVIEVTAEIFEREWSWVEEQQKATMTVRGVPGETFHGHVIRVEPPVGYTTRSLEVRLKFKSNHPNISQSMFAHVSIFAKTRHNLLLVPRDAVIRTGEGERVVLVREGGGFQPVPVVVGQESMGKVEIISGLSENDKVVISGQFLIDSESNLLAGLKRLSASSNNLAKQSGHSDRSMTVEDHSNDMHPMHSSEKSTDSHSMDGHRGEMVNSAGINMPLVK